MPLIRIVLLLVIFGGLALLVLQNLLPVPLVFLGTTTPTLPVGIWIVSAIALGILISSCLQGFSYLQRRSLQARIRQLEAEPTPSSASSSQSRERSETRYTPPAQEPPLNENLSDWEVEESDDDEDWEIDDAPEPESRNDAGNQQTSYEVRQEPKSSAQSGSVYSYSYREPSDSGVGKTEPVYDVNYRVITPPYREATNDEDEEDWGFEDEADDFEEDETDNQDFKR